MIPATTTIIKNQSKGCSHGSPDEIESSDEEDVT